MEPPEKDQPLTRAELDKLLVEAIARELDARGLVVGKPVSAKGQPGGKGEPGRRGPKPGQGGRPRKGNQARVSKTFTLDQEVVTWLENNREPGASVSETIEKIIREHMKT